MDDRLARDREAVADGSPSARGAHDRPEARSRLFQGEGDRLEIEVYALSSAPWGPGWLPIRNGDVFDRSPGTTVASNVETTCPSM